MEQIQRLIGVDFGTSTSLIRVKRYQGNHPVGDSHHAASVTYGNGAGDSKAVTLVRKNEDGTLTCGRYGEEELPGSTIYREFKMDLESRDPEKKANARQLTEEFFRYLYDRYEHQSSDLGARDDEEHTIISYPAKWKPETVEFMKQSAEKAGFPRVTVMDEPSAALYAVLCRKMDEICQQGLLKTNEDGYMLLLDMGAGTTDLAVCGYRLNDTGGKAMTAADIQTRLISTWPTDASSLTFGGREVDRVLEDYVINYLCRMGFQPPMAENLIRNKPNVKLWKEETVSNLLERRLPVNTCSFVTPYMAIFGQSQPFPTFDRGQFQQMLEQGLSQFCQLVTECLDAAEALEPQLFEKGIDLVVLTGGHSSWYFTSDLLDGTMPGLMHPALEKIHMQKERVLRLTNPQETVALGMVYSRLPFRVEDPNPPQPVPEPPKPPAPEPVSSAENPFLRACAGLDADLLKALQRDVNEQFLAQRLQVPPEEVIWFAHDNTVAGSSKYGTIFTNKGIYSHAFLLHSRSFTSWQEIAGMQLSAKDGFIRNEKSKGIANFVISQSKWHGLLNDITEIINKNAKQWSTY